MNYCYRYFLTHVGLDFEVKRKFNIFTSKSYGENVKFETIKHLTDETIITRKNLKKNTQEISIKIGLSKNDVHSLKCLYLNNDIDYEKLCTFQED